MTGKDLASVTATYLCDGGQRVDVLAHRIARIALSDGRVVKIERIENSVPTTFEDLGITFIVYAPRHAELNDDKNRSLACRPSLLKNLK